MSDVTAFANASTTPGTNTSLLGVGILGTSLLSTADDSFRNSMALDAKFYADLAGLNTVSGTANAIAVTTPTLYAAYTNGIFLAFKNTSGPNTTAATLNLDANGAKAIRLQGDSALVGGEMGLNGVYLLRYDTAYNAAAGAWVLLNPAVSAASNPALTSNDPFINFAIGTPSVAASALTIPFTGVDGNALGASNIAYINFRSATAGSGAIAQLALTALASLVISSGSTLGMTSGVAATLALAIFNDAGTARPAIINPLVLPLVDGIASATSEGGAGAADSAGVWYSNAAITSKAYTIVGYITATEAAAGTWATAPSTVQVGPVYAVNNVLPIVTPFVAYTPTFTGFGTATNISFVSRRNKDMLEIRGKWTAGTVTATEARITMGFNGTNANVTSDATKVTSIQLAGPMIWSFSAVFIPNMLIESSVNYLTIGAQASARNGLTKLNGNDLNTGESYSLIVQVPISGW